MKQKILVRLIGVMVLALFLASQVALAQSKLQSGPMVAYSEMFECALWVQTKVPAKVQIAYWETGKPEKRQMTDAKQTEKLHGYTATLIADKVQPTRKYTYSLFIDGKQIALPYPTTFQSQAMWQFRTEPPNFTFAIGSCNYVADTAYDRPGKSYGSNYKIFTAIAANKPDAMLWLGDNTYFREPDWNTRTGMIYRHTHTRSLPELQPLLASAHNYSIWDDHDYGPNDADRSFWGKKMASEIYTDFWPALNENATLAGGKTGTFYWGDAQFFLLDDRWFRGSNGEKNPDKPFFGPQQLTWLKDMLHFSKATFKIIVAGGQMLNSATMYENYSLYPTERQEFLNIIRQSGAQGVLLLSGDRHHTELSKMERDGSYPLYELTCSPLTAGVANPKEVNQLRVPETLVMEHNYALLNFSGARQDRTMNISVRNADGKEVWKRDIKASEIGWGKNEKKD